MLEFLKASPTSIDWGEGGTEYLSVFCVLCYEFLCPFQLQAYIFLCLTFAVYILVEFILLPFPSLATFNSRLALAFLNLLLQYWTPMLHFSWVICPCFHLLKTPGFLSSVKNSFLIPCRTPDAFASFPACRDTFLSLEEVIL